MDARSFVGGETPVGRKHHIFRVGSVDALRFVHLGFGDVDVEWRAGRWTDRGEVSRQMHAGGSVSNSQSREGRVAAGVEIRGEVGLIVVVLLIEHVRGLASVV